MARKDIYIHMGRDAGYTGKYPDRIASVASQGRGVVSITTNNGKKYTVTAAQTGGEMPRTGEEISKWVKGGAQDASGAQTVHKGFTITELSNGKFTIHKDKTVIQHETPTLASAKAIIEQLV